MFEDMMNDMASTPCIEESSKMSEDKKNYRAGYSEYATLEEARQFAKRDTAKSFSSTSIWQRIEETVVPAIDVQINTVDVTTQAVK